METKRGGKRANAGRKPKSEDDKLIRVYYSVKNSYLAALGFNNARNIAKLAVEAAAQQLKDKNQIITK